MKSNRYSLACLGAAFLLHGSTALPAIVVPGADGSDGVLQITANTVIDLSQAVTAAWDANNAANAGMGVYDAEKWAVVFKYSGVNVAAGATVTFKNHPSRAPVVWLVAGDVTIAGTVSVDGAEAAAPPGLAEPGPGGFRGGTGPFGAGVTASAGFGVGGGGANPAWSGRVGASGSYGSAPLGGAGRYGNPSVVPLIGGSGGGGLEYRQFQSYLVGGGAGGGAFLLAASGRVLIDGVVSAAGGGKQSTSQYGAGGSGGAVRIVAERLSGSGQVRAMGGVGRGLDESIASGNGGDGRIRLERVIHDSSLTIAPDPSVVGLAPSATALVWPPPSAPTVRIVSIGGVAAPADPRPGFGASTPDVALPLTSSTPVVVETTYVEEASQVEVRATPRSGGNFTLVTATKDSVVTAEPLTVRWVANLPVSAGYSAVQVKVVRP